MIQHLGHHLNILYTVYQHKYALKWRSEHEGEKGRGRDKGKRGEKKRKGGKGEGKKKERERKKNRLPQQGLNPQPFTLQPTTPMATA